MLKHFAFPLVAGALLASAACTIDVSGEESVVREQQRIKLTGTPHVTIRTFNGSIELRPWDREEILLDIERRAGSDSEARAIVVRTNEEGGNVRIEAEPPPRRREGLFGRWHSPSVHMVVTVPRHLDVEVRSGDGSIRARDLTGRIDLNTGDGGVTLQRVQGDIRVNTGDGSVAATDLDGTVAVHTGDGAVDVAGRLDGVIAHSGDGGIRIDARPGSAVGRDWTITSGDGAVDLRVSADLNATVDAQTGDGQINTTGVIVTASPEAREHGILRGQIGKGGEVLTVRTGDGSITIVAH